MIPAPILCLQVVSCVALEDVLNIELMVEIQGEISCAGDQTKEKSSLMAVLVTWDQTRKNMSFWLKHKIT
jgi:hypothetical protein